MASAALEERLYPIREPHFMKPLVETWTRMVSLATEESSVSLPQIITCTYLLTEI